MDYLNKWEVVADLGQGGQGKVFRVRNRSELGNKNTLRTALRQFIKGDVRYDAASQKREDDQKFQKARECLLELVRLEDPANQGALKVLHRPEDARDPDLARERIEREIDAMSKTLHPNLAEILDVDDQRQWYVMRYYPNGTLANKRESFKGDFRSALKALRPLVEGVAKLHGQGRVHRDIKPDNIFMGLNNELVLGDFGLVYFADGRHTRYSATYENVGSRDWMPGWAMGMRIEDVRPTFDVFALGKVLWSMVSGRSILPLWYYDKEQFNLEQTFPKSNQMRLANDLLSQCVVEEEDACLPDAVSLLDTVDRTLAIIESHGDPIGPDIRRRCKVCAIGEYSQIAAGSPKAAEDFGINPAGDRRIRVFACEHCGHVQIFFFRCDEIPPAWHTHRSDA
jgi:serine/threonine protein kinase